MTTRDSAMGDTGTRRPDREVLGRSRETEIIDAVLDDPSRWPAALVIEGEAGIGKTTLWRRAVDRASDVGYRVLEARPVQAESGLVFAGLGDLLSDAFVEIGDRLPMPQRRAVGAALLLDDPGGGALDPRTVGVAVLSTLRLLAEEAPLVVAIDDGHWLDTPSAAALAFAGRRLRSEPIGFIIARRPDARPDHRPADVTGLRSSHVALGPLSIGALHAVVVGATQTVLPRPWLRRLHDLSHGNPYLALELVRAVEAGRLSLDTAVPVAADLDDLLAARFEPLPKSTRLAVLVVAATSHPTPALVEGIMGIDASDVLRPAIRAGLVVVDRSAIRFDHPLLASTAYGLASDAERRWVHGVLAGIVEDPTERARHLARAAAGPDEPVAAEVEGAADATFRRGAPAAAAELAGLAARLTPVSDVGSSHRRAMAQAEYLFEAGDAQGARVVLDGLIAAVLPGPSRAPLLALQARIRHFGDDTELGVALGRQALLEAGDDDRLLAGIHEGLAWGMFLMRDDLPAAAAHARAAVAASRRTGDEVDLAEGLAIVAVTSLAIGQPRPDAMEGAMALESALLDLRVLRHPSYARACMLAWTDELADAIASLDELEERAREHGDESAIPPILVQRSLAEILAGAWDAADEHARTGAALAAQTGQRPSEVALLGRSALLAAYRGRLGEARELGESALARMGVDGDERTLVRHAPVGGGEVAVWALAVAATADGRPDLAADFLLPMAGRLLDAGVRDPGEVRFLADAVEALVLADRTDEAIALSGRVRELAEASGRAGPLGIARRCAALVEAARAGPDGGLPLAVEAVACLAVSQLPLELARARLVLGGLQRRIRERRAARATLDAAISTFDRLGALGWADEARAERARIGGRPATDGTLTATERRVAELVGAGRANKEVAHALGIAPKTVELHLTHVYAKIGVTSRAELVRRIALGEVGDPGSNP